MALFSLVSVLWQKKYERTTGSGEAVRRLEISSTTVINIIVLPLPGSPLIQSSRASSQFHQSQKAWSSRIHAEESLSKPPFVSWILSLSSRGSVPRKSRLHSSFLSSLPGATCKRWSTSQDKGGYVLTGHNTDHCLEH